jgi:rhodanese-related sulfurtransferase
MQQLSALELADWLAAAEPSQDYTPDEARPRPTLLDVREPWEYELCRLAGSLLMPMHTVPARVGELDRAAEIVVICHHGVRSQQVAMFLERHGFDAIYNLSGGVDAWADEVEPTMCKY